MDLITKLWSL